MGMHQHEISLLYSNIKYFRILGVCPSGEKAFIDSMTYNVRECLPNVAGSCPANYLCRFSSIRNKYYCCSSATGSMFCLFYDKSIRHTCNNRFYGADSGLCPAGKALYRDPNTNQPSICALGSVVNSCPTSYSCQSNIVNSFQGYCCTINRNSAFKSNSI